MDEKKDPYWTIYINYDGTMNMADQQTGIHANCLGYRPNRPSEPWRAIDRHGSSGYIRQNSVPAAAKMAAMLLG